MAQYGAWGGAPPGILQADWDANGPAAAAAFNNRNAQTRASNTAAGFSYADAPPPTAVATPQAQQFGPWPGGGGGASSPKQNYLPPGMPNSQFQWPGQGGGGSGESGRGWGTTLPGYMYPQVEGPGNPGWETRNPQMNPQGNPSYGGQFQWPGQWGGPQQGSGSGMPSQAMPAQRRTQNPWQVNPMVWDSMGDLGQNLALGFAEQDGWDGNDYQRQINASRPQGQAPRSVRTSFQQPRGFR